MNEAASVGSSQRPEINPMFLFRWEDTQDSYVLLYPERVVKLNPTAGEILKERYGTHEIKLDVARRIKAHGFPMVLNVPAVRQNID